MVGLDFEMHGIQFAKSQPSDLINCVSHGSLVVL